MSLEKSLDKKIQNKTKIFKCNTCQKIFSTNGNLKNHINTIHNHILPFKCPFPKCNKSYSNKSRFDVHFRTHSGIKPFSCPICKKKFNEKGNLKTHILFHTNERPFKCPQCEKTYKTNGHLKDHIDIFHYQIKKFKCQICGIKFGRRSTLTAHIKVHFDKKNNIEFNCVEDKEKSNLNSSNLKENFSSSSTSLVSFNENGVKNNNINNINNGKFNIISCCDNKNLNHENLGENLHFNSMGKYYFI